MMKNTYCNEEYLQYMFAYGISPVKEGCKPSGLITIWKYRIPDIQLESYLKQKLREMQCSCAFEILKETTLYYLVFFYHKELLTKIYTQYQNVPLLSGYPKETSIVQIIQCLKSRILEYHLGEKEFPHEVGIFLGYPIWDVEEFIEHKGLDYKLCGYWKVYHDVEGAKEKFKEYDKIRALAVRQCLCRIERNYYLK